MDRLTLAIKLSNMLGWGDMLSHVALPAIDAILEQAAKCGITYEYLLTLDSNDIFGLLAGDCTAEDCESFVALRFEIESAMMNGAPYTEAINEWWK